MPAKDQGSRIGSLVVNPGGPGASGMSYAAAADGIVGTQVRRYFDVVGFDPRGRRTVGAPRLPQRQPARRLHEHRPDPRRRRRGAGAARPRPAPSPPGARPRTRRSCRTCPPPTRPRTWTCCAPRSATASSTTSASPTAPSSARRMPASSPSASAASSSTGSCRPTSPTPRCPRGRRVASSSRPAPTSPTASRRVTARSGPRSRKGMAWIRDFLAERRPRPPSRRATPAPLAWARRGRRGVSGRRCTTRAPGAR